MEVRCGPSCEASAAPHPNRRVVDEVVLLHLVARLRGLVGTPRARLLRAGIQHGDGADVRRQRVAHRAGKGCLANLPQSLAQRSVRTPWSMHDEQRCVMYMSAGNKGTMTTPIPGDDQPPRVPPW